MSKRQQGKSQEKAVACAALSERSGRRIEKGEYKITLGGESYSALLDGLQSALFRAGGSPARTVKYNENKGGYLTAPTEAAVLFRTALYSASLETGANTLAM
jgi:hypothetical protein